MLYKLLILIASGVKWYPELFIYLFVVKHLQAECYHYLFDAALKLHQLGINWSTRKHHFMQSGKQIEVKGTNTPVQTGNPNSDRRHEQLPVCFLTNYNSFVSKELVFYVLQILWFFIHVLTVGVGHWHISYSYFLVAEVYRSWYRRNHDSHIICYWSSLSLCPG